MTQQQFTDLCKISQKKNIFLLNPNVNKQMLFRYSLYITVLFVYFFFQTQKLTKREAYA